MAKASYKIVDADTGNSVGFYLSREEAGERFDVLAHRDPAGDSLVLVIMDEQGTPIETRESPTVGRRRRGLRTPR